MKRPAPPNNREADYLPVEIAVLAFDAQRLNLSTFPRTFPTPRMVISEILESGSVNRLEGVWLGLDLGRKNNENENVEKEKIKNEFELNVFDEINNN